MITPKVLEALDHYLFCAHKSGVLKDAEMPAAEAKILGFIKEIKIENDQIAAIEPTLNRLLLHEVHDTNDFYRDYKNTGDYENNLDLTTDLFHEFTHILQLRENDGPRYAPNCSLDVNPFAESAAALSEAQLGIIYYTDIKQCPHAKMISEKILVPAGAYNVPTAYENINDRIESKRYFATGYFREVRVICDLLKSLRISSTDFIRSSTTFGEPERDNLIEKFNERTRTHRLLKSNQFPKFTREFEQVHLFRLLPPEKQTAKRLQPHMDIIYDYIEKCKQKPETEIQI
jgi:hypothetical protein